MGAAGIPEWYPGEYMRTYWSKGSALIAGEQAAFPVFVAAMAYSDATFLCRADDMGTKSWMTCCQRAFRSLGGVPYVTDCAQCKVSVTARSTIEAFARHYRTVLYGARPKTAKGAEGAGKPLDARTVSHVARKVIADVAGMDFASLEDLDAYVEGKLEAYNAMGSEDGPARWTLFKERELPQMLELPAEDADFATWSTRLVRDDYHFVVDGVAPSVPWRVLERGSARQLDRRRGSLIPQRRTGRPARAHDRDAGAVHGDRPRAQAARAPLVRKKDGRRVPGAR